jgi:hypothetical protein
MQIHIDFSIYVTTPEAFGLVSGSIESARLPSVGETLNILQGRNLPRRIPGFNGTLKVAAISPVTLPDGDSVVISLEDLELTSRDDAKFLQEFLAQEVDLFCIEYKRDLA